MEEELIAPHLRDESKGHKDELKDHRDGLEIAYDGLEEPNDELRARTPLQLATKFFKPVSVPFILFFCWIIDRNH